MSFNRDRNAVIQQYAKLAREYDSRWSSYIRATTDATIERIPPLPGAVLDVGCGTGTLILRLLDEFPRSDVIGVDASLEMLELARSRLPTRVKLQQCWAESLPFNDDSFDTVVSCNMFHYIRQPSIALDEMLRVLRPNGTLVITDWCDDFITCKLCDIYLRWFDPSHFRMYGLSQCRALLEAARASQIQLEKYKVTWLWGLMTATARKQSSITF
ncbi:methylase involved in ubiquinone/menaquinone biosynthesis [Rubidibacter lacunae KORDI 51-2]|uniref:Methylase involved in ubiquinone/menaquinone biosynthesis n=1 Tax=Rubidibacter lacunae KORDI 51-2 TaxID=582515 RepID=U5DA16_9CHRO|nr:class I SAM-dependent methyltransferase [Rubidibacter lacunae]ERN41428.1 methylase involved in ubiquinone/menaquinone biosynthesis [Rubidibacter lacunae KORDI 51-2]